MSRCSTHRDPDVFVHERAVPGEPDKPVFLHSEMLSVPDIVDGSRQTPQTSDPLQALPPVFANGRGKVQKYPLNDHPGTTPSRYMVPKYIHLCP